MPPERLLLVANSLIRKGNDMTDVSQDGDLGAAGGSTGGQTTGDKLKQQFQSFTSQAGEKARDVAGQGVEKATGALDDCASFLHQTADTIEEKVGAQYGQYVHNAAANVESFAGNLRGKDVEELLDDARELVRKSPAVAIGVAAGLGFVLARLVKAGFDYTPTDTGTSGTTGGTQSLAGPGTTGTASPTTGTSGDLGGTGTSGGTGTTGLGGPSTGLPTGGTSVTGSTEPSFPA
jgi:ElaB/YqjD/DUF883 family membrane-anchored ribosome-binding protein